MHPFPLNSEYLTKLPFKITFYSDNILAEEDVKVQHTKGLPIFIGSHFLSYLPSGEIDKYSTALRAIENSRLH